MRDSTTEGGPASRRAVLAGAAGVGAVAALAACGSDDGDPPGDGGANSPPGGGPTGDTSNGLAKTSEIPVNGGKVIDSEKIVITQPSAGTFKAFTAVCTHMGCTVGSVTNNVIKCPCHFSEFSAVDGSVKAGSQASKALAEKQIKVEGDTITLV